MREQRFSPTCTAVDNVFIDFCKRKGTKWAGAQVFGLESRTAFCAVLWQIDQSCLSLNDAFTRLLEKDVLRAVAQTVCVFFFFSCGVLVYLHDRLLRLLRVSFFSTRLSSFFREEFRRTLSSLGA